MSTEIILQNPKVWKRSFVLFGFQLAVGILIAAIVLTLTYVIKIIPPSVHFSSIPATIFGAYKYGYWEEKRNPGILDTLIVKRICKIQACWQFILAELFVFLLAIAQQENFGIVAFIIVSFILLFVFFITYWVTQFFVFRGISFRQKEILKQSQLSV